MHSAQTPQFSVQLRGRSKALMNLQRTMKDEPEIVFTRFSAARQPDSKKKQVNK